MTSAQQLIGMARLALPAGPFDWEQAEQVLELRLPQDYRALVDAGGAGL